MNRTSPTPMQVVSQARARVVLRVLLFAAPWIAVAMLHGSRTAQSTAAWWPLPVMLVATAFWLARSWRAHDVRWLAARLNRDPSLEDSAELLLGMQPPASPLALLQGDRLHARWPRVNTDTHLPDWRGPALLANLLLALALASLAWALQQPMTAELQSRLPPAVARVLAPSAPSVRGIRLQVDPPAHTGLASSTLRSGAARVPEGSVLTWRVAIRGAPTRAWLEIDQGVRIPLQRQDDGWYARRRVDRSILYRIVTEPALPPAQRRLHALSVVRDQPPRVRSIRPAASLTLRSPGQRTWPLLFEATDDHGIASHAELRIIQTSGDGENITSSERVMGLTGSGPPKQRRFSYTFDLARSGLTVGNDVIVQLTVRDNRSPRPQVVRSSSVILRWPPEQADTAGGLDGLAQRALPAYFRSQRQIIMDAEALLRAQGSLASETFAKRSNAIGADQHTLRLRYGQFLGEEAEDAAPLPTNDVDQGQDPQPEAPPGGGHAHEDGTPPPAPDPDAGGSGVDAMLAEVSHIHDLPEAATLLDPQTQDVLRAALREMWESERQLRQGAPGDALPYAYRALALIKQVQQADRIYLPRLGSELPPIDFNRRLSGKREGMVARSHGTAAPAPEAMPMEFLWLSLSPDRDAVPVPSGAFAQASRWLEARGRRDDQALATLAALDQVRQVPACTRCRQQLRNALWTHLRAPLAAPRPRARSDAAGNAYLDALQREVGR